MLVVVVCEVVLPLREGSCLYGNDSVRFGSWRTLGVLGVLAIEEGTAQVQSQLVEFVLL